MWYKSYLFTDVGRSLGIESDETIYFNPEARLLYINFNGQSPYFAPLESYSNYRIGLVDPHAFKDVLGIEEKPVIEEVKAEIIPISRKKGKK